MRQPTRPAARDGHPNGRSNPIRHMYLTVAITAAVFAFWTPTAFGWQPGEHAAQRHCQQGRVLSCIHRAALHFHQSFGSLKSVSWCESRWNPAAKNPLSDATGLFQIMYPSTWNTTRYWRHSPWSAKWNSLAAASMFAAGRSREWACVG